MASDPAPPSSGDGAAFQTRHQEWITSVPGFSGWSVGDGEDGRPHVAVYLVDGHPDSERVIRERLAGEATVEFVPLSAPFEFHAQPAPAPGEGPT